VNNPDGCRAHRSGVSARLSFTLVLAMVMALAPAVGAIAVEPATPETVVDEVEGFAPGGSIAGREVSTVTESPIAFTMIGFNHPRAVDVEFRTSADGVAWSDWTLAEAMDDEDGPDRGTAESAAAEHVGARVHTEPVWTGEARYLQVRAEPQALAALRATIIDSDGVSRSLFQRVRDSLRPGVAVQAAEARSAPTIITRSQWGANESWRGGSPSYASDVRYGVVHHTAGSNTYTSAESAAVVRGIYSYHTRTLGWNDIGYNFLVDRFGRIYEGRAGGVTRGVVGAHAQGFNSGSFGVSIMGNFTSVAPPPVAQEAVAQVSAWKFWLHGIQPKSTITVRSGGSPKYAAGTQVRIDTLIGHRDVGQTACPGTAFYNRMWWLRDRIAALVATYPAGSSFPDVSQNAFYYDAVNWMVDTKITDGFGNTNNFEPNLSVTRAQMAAFLWRMMDAPTGYPAHGFPDVPSNSYYEQAVRWAKAEGVTNGFGNTGMYEPHRNVTRGEMASFLWRTAGSKPGATPHDFPDVPRSAHYDAPVSWALFHGITNGYGNTGRFEPNLAVTRGETAAFMHRLASVRGAWGIDVTSPSTAEFNR
jgi:hypothetical protein